MLKNSLLRLHLKAASYGTDFVQADASRFAHEGISEIKKAIEPYGYFNSDVSLDMSHKRSHVLAHYTVELGPILRVRQFSVVLMGEGKVDPKLQQIIKQFELASDKPWTAAAYKHDVTLFETTAAAMGYLKSESYASTVSINRDENWADVVLRLNTGIRYYFGTVRFDDKTYSHKFLHRFVPFKEGDPFSLNLLGKLRSDLLSADLFRSVSVEKLPSVPSTPNTIPVKVESIAEKPFDYYAGVGVSSDDGIGILLGTHIRRIRTQGQHANIALRFTDKLLDFSVGYIVPGVKPASDYYALESHFISKNKSEIGNSRILNLGFRSVKVYENWSQELGVYSLREHSYPVEGGDFLSILVYPQISYSRSWQLPSTVMAPIETRVTFLGSSSALLSDISFYQARFEWGILQPIRTYGRLKINNRIGKTWRADITKMPLSLQLVTGGASSVRGYSYNSIGPGRTLKVVSVEWQQAIKNNWYGLVFHDRGIASDKLSDAMMKSVGVGVMWNMPLGDLELTYAKALDLSGKPWRVQLSVSRIIGGIFS